MKRITKILLIIFIAVCSSGCATILGGHVTEAQRTKPKLGEPSRQIRVGALIADIVLGGFVFPIIDFATCAIYKPEPSPKTAKK